MVRNLRAAAIGVIAAGFFVAAAPASAADRQAHARVIGVEGVAKHDRDIRVEILVQVPAGTSARNATTNALDSQGATRVAAPPQSAAYTFTGLHWDRFPVVQSYNGAGSRSGGAATALTNTYPDWSSVSGSAYRIQSGAITTRCPSLVRECPGAQRNDRFNDVGWASLGSGILGVTWSTSSTDEADMAINTRYAWSTGCRQVSGAFDLESVYLHENGHVAGLGHSSDPNAVMYPSYRTARCTLGTDDQKGLVALYH